MADAGSWVLFLSFLVACLRPNRPYPVLILGGAQGTAKTTLTRVIRQLVDPNLCPDRAPPKDEEALMIAASNNHVCSFDNISRLTPNMADAVCRLSTGGSIGGRELYTNNREVTWRALRPVVMNGIGAIATRDDLLERSIMIALARISEENRKTEAAFWIEFEAKRARVIGALFEAVSGALRRLPEAENLSNKPRMADFYCWAVAAESGLGLRPGEFATAFAANRRGTAEVSLEASPVAQHICAMSLPWEGTVEELLAAVRNSRPSYLQQLPKNARWLSDHLTRLQSVLHEVGISVTKLQRQASRRAIRIELTEWRSMQEQEWRRLI